MGKKKFNLGIFLCYVVLGLAAFVTLFPVISVLFSSFKSSLEILVHPESIFPKEWTLDGYKRALNSESFNVLRMSFNSLWFSAANTAIVVFISAMCGYVFARGEFRGKQLIFAVFTALMFVNLGAVTTYPTLKLVANLGLANSLFGLLVVQCFGIPITNMYIARGFINSLPKELDEAAIVDGCSFTSTFFYIYFPLLKPMVATIGALAFVNSWNSYLMPSIFTMNAPKQQTLMVGIQILKSSGESAVSWDILFAATVLSIIPVLIVFAFFSKQMVDGMTAGAVKG